MYRGFLASSSLLWPEIWQSNARTRCVGWSLCTVPQIKQVSVVIKMTRQMNLTGRANPSLIERNIPGVHGVAIGICLWLTQLVWIRLGTDRQRLRANTTSVPTPSVIGFCFTSLVLFSFFLSFTFTSDGLIVMTVAASISGDIVYSISNLKWMDGCPMRCFGGGVGWEGCFSFTWPMLFYVGNCSYTLRAVLYGGVLLHLWCFFFNAGSLFSMACSISYQEFVLHTLCKFMCGDFLIVCPVFFRVKSFFYVPHAVLCGKFLLQIYVPCISLSGEFLLHTPC